MLAGFLPEWWPLSCRNGGRIRLEYAPPLRAFPNSARQEAGFQMDKVQRSKEPDNWKPMTTVGQGVKEIRIRDEAVYVAKLVDAIYVLHCFQKKTQVTSQKDISLARKRYKDLMKEQQQ
jgi:phage-related protein